MLVRMFAILSVCMGVACTAYGQVEVVPQPAAVATKAQPISVYHSGWGSIRGDGSLNGRVVTVAANGDVVPQAGAMVTLMRDQAVAATATADGDGAFSLQGLVPGVYEMTAESSGAFAALSFQAIAAGGDDQARSMNVYASAMPRSEVDRVLQELWTPQTGMIAARTFEDVVPPVMPAAQSQRVAIRGGMVYGQVAWSNPFNIPEAHVAKVFRGGQLIATAPVDAMGRFTFSPGGPGVVDVVVGGTAYGSIGVELVDVDAPAQLTMNADGSKFVAAANALLQSNSLLVPTVGGGAPPAGPGGPAPGEMLGPPLAGGGFMGPGGGGFAGGGGGGGGLGGLGGLAGAAALAVGIAALADDDDGFDGNLATGP